MDQREYRLPSRPGLSLSAEDADRLLALSDGDCALLYLYILRCGGVLDARDACAALKRSETAVADAARKLRDAGLLGEAPRFTPPADELPPYDAEEIVRRSREDPAFQVLVTEAQAKLGHGLSRTDLEKLFGIYDQLGLPSEVILLIINRCAETARKRWGEQRLPTMRAIEREAYAWVNREIVTLEQAEEYLAALDRREQEGEELRRLLQIDGRQPTATERRYMESWLEMDFPRESLELAYDRTVVGTGGKFVWKYMDRILCSWKEKGLRTPREIEAGDTRPGRRAPAPRGGGKGPAAPRTGGDIDLLEQMLNGKG